MSLAQFGQTIKAKYPDYASIPDEEIGRRMLTKYPEYADRVDQGTPQPESPAQFGAAQNGRAREDYGPGELAVDNAREFALGGAERLGVDLQSPIVGTVKNLVGGAAHMLKEHVMGRGAAMAPQIIEGITEPYLETVKGLRAGDYQKAAHGAGGVVTDIAGAVLAGSPGAAQKVGNVPKKALGTVLDPESLKLRAAANRVPQAGGLTISDLAASSVGGVAGGGPGAVVGMGLNRLRKAQKFRNAKAGVQEGLADYIASADKAPVYKDTAAPIVRNDVPLPEGILPPELGVDYTPRLTPEATPAVRQDIPFEMPADNAPPYQFQDPPPLVRNDIPFNVELPPPAPRPPDYSMIERGIAPSGEAAQRSTLKNAPKLAEELPELQNIPPGDMFDRTLVDGFKRVEGDVEMVENQIPRSTTVPKAQIISTWKELVQEYAGRGLPKSVRSLERVLETWEKLPSAIPWDTFLGLKRSFFKEAASASSSTMRRAYGTLMEATSQISPELAQANKSYSVVRRALDDARLDPITGRRIRKVGKPEPSIKQSGSAPRKLIL